jgi:hypothetical protein
MLSSTLAATLRVDYYAPDLSEEAIENALEQEAADLELPLNDRVQAMFLSAQRDYAWGRFDEALKKHEVVLKYHSAIGNAPMVAFVLNSVGEIHQRAGRPGQTSRCFEAALEPACGSDVYFGPTRFAMTERTQSFCGAASFDSGCPMLYSQPGSILSSASAP